MHALLKAEVFHYLNQSRSECNQCMKMCSARKNAEDLKKALEAVVVPMFCNTSIGITEEQQTKLNKVLYSLHTV